MLLIFYEELSVIWPCGQERQDHGPLRIGYMVSGSGGPQLCNVNANYFETQECHVCNLFVAHCVSSSMHLHLGVCMFSALCS